MTRNSSKCGLLTQNDSTAWDRPCCKDSKVQRACVSQAIDLRQGVRCAWCPELVHKVAQASQEPVLAPSISLQGYSKHLIPKCLLRNQERPSIARFHNYDGIVHASSHWDGRRLTLGVRDQKETKTNNRNKLCKIKGPENPTCVV